MFLLFFTSTRIVFNHSVISNFPLIITTVTWDTVKANTLLLVDYYNGDKSIFRFHKRGDRHTVSVLSEHAHQLQSYERLKTNAAQAACALVLSGL